MLTDNSGQIERRASFMLAYQLEGFVESVSQLTSNGVALGSVTRQWLRDLINGAKTIGSGRSFEILPSISDELADADVAVIAATLRSTILAFLTPDEMSEQQHAFGLHPNNRHSGAPAKIEAAI